MDRDQGRVRADIFPPYMGGPDNICSYDLVKNLVKATNDPKHKPFKFEDVNIGIILDGMDENARHTKFFLGTHQI